MLRKSRQDERFCAAAAVCRRLTGRWIQILPDDVTPELATVVQRISRLPVTERMRHGKTRRRVSDRLVHGMQPARHRVSILSNWAMLMS
jgi:hypothetical protein